MIIIGIFGAVLLAACVEVFFPFFFFLPANAAAQL